MKALKCRFASFVREEGNAEIVLVSANPYRRRRVLPASIHHACKVGNKDLRIIAGIFDRFAEEERSAEVSRAESYDLTIT